MALVKCPECGNDVSDKAQSCPHCGFPLEKQETACPECGKELSADDTYCPNCGYPISSNKSSNEKLINTGDSSNTTITNTNIFFVIAVIAAIIWVICWYYEASHGVRLAEEEIYYTVSHYKSTTFILGRICAIAKPICLITGLISIILGILRKNQKI